MRALDDEIMVEARAKVLQAGSHAVRMLTLGHQAGIRELRAILFEACVWLKQQPAGWVILATTKGRLVERRILREFEAARNLAGPGVGDRLLSMMMSCSRAPSTNGWPAWLDKGLVTTAMEDNLRAQHGSSRPAFPQVLMVLMQDLLGGRAVRTRSEMGVITGLRYPAIARALAEIGDLVEDGYRALRLRDFPGEAWDRLYVTRSSWRRSQNYCVATGLPFKPDRFLRNLRELNRADLALGGVVGARTYGPFDLVGIPRIDISQFTMAGKLELEWVQTMAPELRACAPGESPHLVVHAVRRADALFHSTAHGIVADPAEVLLDLQDLRLEEQASAFLQAGMAGRHLIGDDAHAR